MSLIHVVMFHENPKSSHSILARNIIGNMISINETTFSSPFILNKQVQK